MARSSSLTINIIKVNGGTVESKSDVLAVEEPLEIRIVFGAESDRKQKSISITMRTPGNDFELATGFLFTEVLIVNADDIQSINHCNGLS